MFQNTVPYRLPLCGAVLNYVFMKSKKIVLVQSFLLTGLLLIACNNVNNKLNTSVRIEKNVLKSKNTAQIKPSYVCYVNNKYMGVAQISVKINNKTYYGCCNGCVVKLKKNLNNVRYATDPLTGAKVDKATAFIVLKPHTNGSVLYFESEDNYKKYFK